MSIAQGRGTNSFVEMLEYAKADLEKFVIPSILSFEAEEGILLIAQD